MSWAAFCRLCSGYIPDRREENYAMPVQTLEALEERVAAVETRLEQLGKVKEADKSDEEIPWWKRIVGIHADCPEFEEAVKLGKEWRESKDPQDEDAA